MTLCSVVVATYRRPGPLASCLAALAALERPRDGDLEVVVVDDGGGMPLDGALDTAHGRLDLTLVRQSNRGPAAARNAGAARARGRLLLFTDDDCAPRPDWLARLVEASEDHPGAIVAGRTVNALRGNLCAEVAQAVIDVGYSRDGRRPGTTPFYTTNNMLVPAEGFRSIGGFDPSFRTAEDRDFCARWHAAGRPCVHAPDAVVEHSHRMDLEGFMRLHHAYGRGAFRFHRAQVRRGGRVAIEPSYYRALARLPFHRPARERVAVSGLLVAWLVATTTGFAQESVASRR